MLHWSLSGFGPRGVDLALLVGSAGPSVLSIQETDLGVGGSCALSGCEVVRGDRPGPLQASGGVALFVGGGLPFSEILLASPLEAVAVTTFVPRRLTVCSLYLPPRDRVVESGLLGLLDGLPPPFLLFGDLNARGPLWGSSAAGLRGRVIDDLISSFPLHLFSGPVPAFLSSSSAAFSCLD